jgi:phage tail-like protein
MIVQTSDSINQIDQTENVILSHIVDSYNRYPGEEVCFITSINFDKSLSGSVLSVALPEGLQLIEHWVDHPDINKNTFVRDLTSGQVVDVHIDRKNEPGLQIQLKTKAHVMNVRRLVYLVSIAEIRNKQGELIASESIRVAVHPAGKYMKFLPEIYHDNEFLGRYLMLFESFWKPIDQQINQMDLYFDPDLTPTTFLPWLASWLGVTWDDSLPEMRKRKLLHMAVMLYQRRGTKTALEDYLKIYTGGEIEIIEHRAQNFILGKHTKLGSAVALGSQNLPHTFTVNVKIDNYELDRMQAKDLSRNKQAYYQKLEEIIEERKPGHTAFNLNLEIKNSSKSGHEVGKDSR